MKKAVMWVAGCAAATVAIVAWLTGQVELTVEERMHVLVGTGAVAAFVTGAVVLALRKA